MRLPTDEQLEKRAEELAQQWFNVKGPFIHPARREGSQDAYKFATLEALKVDRESLRLLEATSHPKDCDAAIADAFAASGIGMFIPCTCGLSTHIALLKSRLGIR